jgi:hypothetical protein
MAKAKKAKNKEMNEKTTRQQIQRHGSVVVVGKYLYASTDSRNKDQQSRFCSSKATGCVGRMTRILFMMCKGSTIIGSFA